MSMSYYACMHSCSQYTNNNSMTKILNKYRRAGAAMIHTAVPTICSPPPRSITYSPLVSLNVTRSGGVWVGGSDQARSYALSISARICPSLTDTPTSQKMFTTLHKGGYNRTQEKRRRSHNNEDTRRWGCLCLPTRHKAPQCGAPFSWPPSPLSCLPPSRHRPETQTL
jgi:hypothetical protein